MSKTEKTTAQKNFLKLHGEHFRGTRLKLGF